MTDATRRTPQLFVAFDGLAKDFDETMKVLNELADTNEQFGIKFNLDSMIAEGMLVPNPYKNYIKCFGRPTFADIKMWNGSRTMESVVKHCVELGVDYVNVYALADKELAKAVKATEGSNTKILALTILSHYDDAYCQKWFRRTLKEAVVDFSRFAVDAGCHGIILPGTALNEVHGLDTIKVATGIRPLWYRDSRHEQEVTPRQAIADGADIIVCGSPILKHETENKRMWALRAILIEMTF